ncbi:EamA family transporter [Bordetella sp. 2513F-2]
MTDFALVLLVSVLTCAGQMLQKQAVRSWQGRPATRPWRRLGSPWLIGGLAALGCAMAVWLYVLHRMPLGVAYPMLSMNLVLVLLGSRVFFGERITLRNWLGAAAIILGLFLLGGSA